MKFRRPEEESFAFELTPLIDVVFLLLIFFMVSTAFIEFTKKLKIELPESRASTVEQEVKSHLVEINAKGLIFLDGTQVTLEQLGKKLEAPQGRQTKRTVLIKADKKVDYGRVVGAMGAIKAVGIKEIGIAVK
jgi:biopolymer transport protein ExbD